LRSPVKFSPETRSSSHAGCKALAYVIFERKWDLASG
jgi:hypothetical protein